MLINDEWRKRNPINDILEPYETLLWIGRPNEEIYVRGNRTPRGIITRVAWTTLFSLIADVGLAFYIGDDSTAKSIKVFCGLTLLGALFVFNYVAFAPVDCKRAEWYAFSEKRIFLAAWDPENSDFAIFQTDFGNLRTISVRKSKKVPEEVKGIGNLVCAYERSIQMRISNHFTFELIDNPEEVQTLLLDAKAASAV